MSNTEIKSGVEYQDKKKNRKIFILLFIFFIIIVVIIGIVLLINKGKNGDSKTSKKTVLTAEQCQENAKLYDGKVLSIKGENIIGRIELTANVAECRLEAQNIIILTADLKENPYNQFTGLYNYVGYLNDVKMEELKKRSTAYGTGVITPIYANYTQFQEKYDYLTISNFYNPNNADTNTTQTNHFLITNSRWFDLSPEGYQELMSLDVIQVIDSKDYVVKEVENGYDTYTTDLSNAELKGDIVDFFSFEIVE